MIRKLFQSRPVASHVVKVALFLAVQGALWMGLRAGVDPPAEMARFDFTEAFLREQLYPHWQADHHVLDRITNPAVTRHPILERLAYHYTVGPDAYLAAIKDKERLLEETPGPRLICVGGSGLAFGFDSLLLAERYAYHPVNLGLHAAFGGEFMLRWAGENARPGDVVLLCLEAPVMAWDFDMTSERRKGLLTLAPEMAKYLEPTPAADVSWSECLGQYKTYADKEALAAAARKARGTFGQGWDQWFSWDQGEAERFFAEFAASREQLLAIFRQTPAITDRVYPRAYYCRSACNVYGDFTAHRGRPRPPAATDLNLNAHPNLDDPKVASQTVKHLQRLNRFARDCEMRGIRVCFAYPPLIESANVHLFATRYETLVEEHLKIPVLNEIDQMILADDLFFDSPHHLTWPGTCRRMQNLIAGLDRLLEPRVPFSPARHVAARNRAVRKTIVAAGPTSSVVY